MSINRAALADALPFIRTTLAFCIYLSPRWSGFSGSFDARGFDSNTFSRCYFVADQFIDQLKADAEAS